MATSAQFTFPRACAIQPEAPNLLFIAGDAGVRIRVLDLTAGTVSTVAGGGAPYGPPSYPTPVGGFADGAGPNAALFANVFDITFEPTTPGWLYVADRFAVRKVDVRVGSGTWGSVSTLAGSASVGSAADGSGGGAGFALLRGGLQP